MLEQAKSDPQKPSSRWPVSQSDSSLSMRATFKPPDRKRDTTGDSFLKEYGGFAEKSPNIMSPEDFLAAFKGVRAAGGTTPPQLPVPASWAQDGKTSEHVCSEGSEIAPEISDISNIESDNGVHGDRVIHGHAIHTSSS